MKFLFVADPVEKIRPAGDSTLVLVREIRRRGHEAWWTTGADVEYVAGEVAAYARKVERCEMTALPELGKRERQALASLDAVLIRKDPPFDTGYVRLCWLLALAEPKVWMLNRPSLLLRYHEKLVPLEAVAQGYLREDDVIPSHLGAHESAVNWVRSRNFTELVTKPFLGYGGRGVARMSDAEFARAHVSRGGVEELLVQPFRDEINRFGDRRVFFLDGEILAHFVRRPKEGDFISNLAQGGTAVAEPLLPEHRQALERLGKFLKAAGIALAGADLIGRYVSEVNITSPTGLKSLESLEGNDYAHPIIDFAERSVSARRR